MNRESYPVFISDNLSGHEQHSLFVSCVLMGTFNFKSQKTLYSLSPGNLMVFKGKLPGDLPRSSDFITLRLYGPLTDILLPKLSLGDNFSKNLGHLLYECKKLLSQPDTSPAEISAAAYNLLINLREGLTHYQKTEGYPKFITDALLLINEQSSYLYSAKEIADNVGVSTEHLIRTFKSCLGTTPGKYLKKKRIKDAKELLITTDMTADTIAQITGFSEGDYFSKAFKKETGLTPGEFRRLNQNPNEGSSPENNYIYL